MKPERRSVHTSRSRGINRAPRNRRCLRVHEGPLLYKSFIYNESRVEIQSTLCCCVYIGWIVGGSFTKFKILILSQPCVQAETSGHVSIVKLGARSVSA